MSLISDAISTALAKLIEGSAKVDQTTTFINELLTKTATEDVTNPENGELLPSLQKAMEQARVDAVAAWQTSPDATGQSLTSFLIN